MGKAEPLLIYIKTSDVIYHLLDPALKKPIAIETSLNLQQVLDFVLKKCPYFEEFSWKGYIIKRAI